MIGCALYLTSNGDVKRARLRPYRHVVYTRIGDQPSVSAPQAFPDELMSPGSKVQETEHLRSTVITIKYPKRPSNSPVLRSHVTDISHSGNRNASCNLSTVSRPKLTTLKGGCELARYDTPPPGGCPRCLSYRAVHDLAPLLSTDD